MDTAPIRDFALKARALLTKEAQDLLEGIYGLHPDGHFESAEKLPAVQELAEVKETRMRLEQFLVEEESAGLSKPDAYTKLVKETAFTHLNRLVAFKMIEARGLRRRILDKGLESNEFKFYLADAAHAGDYDLYQLGGFPQDALGEGPRDRAYRHFLLWLSGETAQEIKVLFDPANLPSRLFPRLLVLAEILTLLNDPALAEAWQPGNEETIGWVYQYYNEEEKKSVFDRLFKQKQKIRVEDIPAATQLFTPRWIVEFLVQNSLGRLWLEIHPDSTLREQLGYLVPPAQIPAPRPLRLARELTFLDPACGTMHFGLVAFDLLHAMYREELQRAGTPGWPGDASVRSKEEIPGAIIAFNLHGIDIDLRAVQLSALALYLKAKAVNPKARFTDSHLVCADVLLLNGPRLEKFLTEKGKGRPVFARICQALWPVLQNARQMGTLVRLERTVRQVIDEARKEYESASLFPDRRRFADLYQNPLGFWESLENEILNALDQFAREKGDRLEDQSLFSGEAAKGIRVLDLMLRHYDTVCTNPPYMSDQNMNATMTVFLKETYPRTKGDLYTAFIERSAELLGGGGRLGMITQQSFMFLSSFEQMRVQLREKMSIETMVHVGPRAFAEIGGEKVNTTLFVLRREMDPSKRKEAVGTYFRLVKEPDAQAKRVAFERAVAHVRQVTVEQNEAWQEGACPADGRVFRYRQGDFDAIPGNPWVYWITPGLRRLFKDLPKLKEVAEPRQGLATADNFRFLRFWWEVSPRRIGFGCADAQQAQATGKHWFPYTKGGSFLRWYGNQEYTVNWAQDGAEIKEHICLSYPYLDGKWEWVAKNPDFYFRRGVTFNRISSTAISARYVSNGFIFDCNGPMVFNDNPFYLCGMMNSAAFYGLLSFLAPTITYQVGDVALAPIPNIISDTLRTLTEDGITLAKAFCQEDEATFDFLTPPWSGSLEATLRALAERRAQLAETESQIDEEVYRLYGISDSDRRAIEAELGNGAFPSEVEEESQPSEDEEGSSSLSAQELAFRWISYAVGIALGRFQPGIDGALGRGDFPPETATQLRALADEDGIATLDPDHSDDLAGKVERILEIALGESRAREVLTVSLGPGANVQGLRDFLARDFWKIHIQQYRKRPCYWLLQSPKKTIGYYLFHERATRDSLPLVRGSRYLGGKIRFMQTKLTDLQAQAAKLEGREKRLLEKEAETVEERLADLEAFDRNLAQVLEAANSRGETVGWAPEIDDGVLINLAPLHALLPSWKAEPKKCWDELAKGSYDWSHTAMRYWPDRVLAKCQSNKSYAIAHGHLELFGKEAER